MRSLKRLSHREWSTLRDNWIAHLPDIDFSTQYPEPTLGQLPPIEHTLDAAGIAELPYPEGIREAVFREAMLLVRKFIYCGALLLPLSAAGKNTWTAMLGYEAAFYGAKAFCYLLGFANLGRSSKLFLDIFPISVRKVGKNKVLFYDTIKIHRLDDRLTHELLWALTSRLIETTRFEEDLIETQTCLKLIDWDSFSSFRNSVMYDGAFWPSHADMDACDLCAGVFSPLMAEASLLAEAAQNAPFASEYFLAAAHFKKIIEGMLESLAELAPAVGVQVEALRILGQPQPN